MSILRRALTALSLTSLVAGVLRSLGKSPGRLRRGGWRTLEGPEYR